MAFSIGSLTGHLRRDLRESLRRLTRRPIFTIAAVGTLAIGIGANTAVFSVVRSLLFRPLPYRNAERLVAIAPNQFMANRVLNALRSRTRSYDAVAAFSPGWLMAHTGVLRPGQLDAARVSGNMFAMLGVPPAIGRVFGTESEAADRGLVTVLSDRLWRREFGADPGVVGRSMLMNGEAYQILGVMPPGFEMFDVDTDLWTPLAMDPAAMTWTGSSALLYGRLGPTATTGAASAELTTVFGQLRSEFGQTSDWALGAAVVDLRESVVGGLRSMLLVLGGGVLFMLTIAIANVAGLFALRTGERQGELAVRRSLGAGRLEIARLLMVEALVVAAIGGGLGVAIGFGGVELLRTILPANLPRLGELAIDGQVLGFAAVISVIAAVGFGLLPLFGRPLEPGLSLRESRATSGHQRTRGALVAAQIALAVVLATGAVLMARSLSSLLAVDPGLRSDHLLTMRIQPTGSDDEEVARVYWREVLGRVRAMPGVVGAATILHLPTSGRSWGAAVEIEGRPLDAGAAPPRTAWQVISTGYFRTAGVPVLQGRDFDEGDRSNTDPVIAINSAFADRLLPGVSPLGMRIKAGNATADAWATIVAVVGSVRHDSLNRAPVAEVYRPIEQRMVGATSLIVRTTAVPEAMAAPLQERIWSVDRDVPISQVTTMNGLFSRSLARPRALLSLLGLFAAIGIVLGSVGIYGMAASWVAQRDREIAVRIALGADRRSVTRLVVGQGIRSAAIGVAIGLPLAAAVAGAMRTLLYGIGPLDPLSLTLVATLLACVAVVATWLPARRAARTDPGAALRG